MGRVVHCVSVCVDQSQAFTASLSVPNGCSGNWDISESGGLNAFECPISFIAVLDKLNINFFIAFTYPKKDNGK